MSLLNGKILVVTGGFGALGRVVGEMALAAGAAGVALVDVAPEPQTLPDALGGDAVLRLGGVDLQVPAQAAAALDAAEQRFGRIDALANVAGGFVWETLSGGDVATWDRLFGQNVRTAAVMSQAASARMAANGRGAIVNVGANAAIKAAAGMGAYAASKAGVHRLTEALAEELKSGGVRVNAVLPSILDTPANRKDMPDADFSAWVTPAELAQVILFLCSDQATGVTGALLPVTGRV